MKRNSVNLANQNDIITQFEQHSKILHQNKLELENKLNDLKLKYYEMGKAVLGQTEEQLNLTLESIQKDPNQTLTAPLLQEYSLISQNIQRIMK